MLNRVRGLVRKELQVYFNSPVAYIAILFFLLGSSIYLFTVEQFLARNTASLRACFGIFPALFVVILPSLTMRSFAEERHSGSDELLLTLPAAEKELVIGKFIALLIFVSLMLILTIPIPLTLTPLGDFDSGDLAFFIVLTGAFLYAAERVT
jgi:ABC-2 type transport system permease protein